MHMQFFCFLFPLKLQCLFWDKTTFQLVLVLKEKFAILDLKPCFQIVSDEIQWFGVDVLKHAPSLRIFVFAGAFRMEYRCTGTSLLKTH